ncbi:AHH domain-containing protein [Acinetobacter sp. ME22]|uniref:AHH domain-containing protein n=1 Tax=Acinetobacter sp. ME22 TaxID=2904802 RepID=UPI001EDB9BFE|nr:AHH domain-containing protein [Acinetobacter sp. ME22]MCG2574848.1 AHH domain-containing protein [Acinetobacter sp. ME22]
MNANISTWSGYQAQHILPSQMRSHPVIQKIGMDFDNAQNGIFLRIPDDGISPMARHQGFHSVYNQVVRQRLDAMDINQSVGQLEKQVFTLQQQLRGLQQNGLPLYGEHGATIEMWNRWLDK